MKNKQTTSITANIKPDDYTLLGTVADEIKTEDCLLQSAFLLDNSKRIIVYTSCHTGISSFECDEDWKPYEKPFATAPPEMMTSSYTDYHKRIRKMHGEEKLVKEHSSELTQ